MLEADKPLQEESISLLEKRHPAQGQPAAEMMEQMSNVLAERAAAEHGDIVAMVT